jgi:hypothetical protein
MTTTRIPHTTRELDSRTCDGIHVRLLWSEHDDRITVAVADAKTDDAFVVEVRPGERALDVFHHPYAFAAWHEGEQTGAPTTQPLSRLAA